MAGSFDIPTDARQWYAVRTFFRREKQAIRLMEARGIDCWLPTIEKIRTYKRKVRRVELPLLSTYVFVRIDRSDYVPVLETEGVIRFVQPGDSIQPVPEREIDLLRQVIGEKLALEVVPHRLEEGDKIELIGGELTGLSGRLVSWKGKERVAVSLDSIGHSILMEVPVSALRKVG